MSQTPGWRNAVKNTIEEITERNFAGRRPLLNTADKIILAIETIINHPTQNEFSHCPEGTGLFCELVRDKTKLYNPQDTGELSIQINEQYYVRISDYGPLASLISPTVWMWQKTVPEEIRTQLNLL